ncbi:MAG: DUF423 domain-containing protein [Cytophagaceae bacterium]
MHKFFLTLGSIAGGLAVMIGAFGAHALRKTLEASGRLETFETAVKYQFYHALALLAVGILLMSHQNRLLNYAGYSFIGGMLIFSGSLYILSMSGVTKWGAVTPFGGVLFIVGWILLCWSVIKHF